jgi:hypothetical protein
VLIGYFRCMHAEIHHCCVFHTGMSDSEKDICDRRSGSVGGRVSDVNSFLQYSPFCRVKGAQAPMDDKDCLPWPGGMAS